MVFIYSCYLYLPISECGLTRRGRVLIRSMFYKNACVSNPAIVNLFRLGQKGESVSKWVRKRVLIGRSNFSRSLCTVFHRSCCTWLRGSPGFDTLSSRWLTHFNMKNVNFYHAFKDFHEYYVKNCNKYYELIYSSVFLANSVAFQCWFTWN